MNRIIEIARRNGVYVVEDNAHGLFATYHGRKLGTIGALATQSFHETKNFTCGEGGALVINDERHIERAEIIREKGTNRARFFRGQVDKYSWVDLGSSYIPSDILAAFLTAQFEGKDTIQTKRRAIWERYNTELAPWASATGVSLPFVPDHCLQAYHMFYLLMPSLEERTRFIAYLKERDINAVFHYVPLHDAVEAVRLGSVSGDCRVAKDISDRLVRLPFYNDFDDGSQSRVIEAVTSFPMKVRA
jgi:dTDP-4-amino-4,6-dideoxygalactose transaminase